MSTTQSKLKPVRYYTSLDPYYVDVDNRPLQDIMDNMNTIADQLDLTKGSFNRGSLAAASIGVQFSANEGFVGNLYYPGGLSLNILFGYLIQSIPYDNNNAYFRVPTMAVHDSPTNLVNVAAPVTAGNNVKYLLQAYMEEADATSIVPGIDSLTKVCRFALKSSGEYLATAAEPTIYPDTGHTAVLSFILTFGQTSITEANIVGINWVDQSNISDLVNGQSLTKLEKARFAKSRANVTVPLGSKVVDLSAYPDFDWTLGKDSFEVFLTGVNQVNFSIDPVLHTVTLGGELTYAADVQIVQTKIYTYKNPTV